MNKVRESVFPDSLMIRDVGIYDDLGGGGQRIHTTAGQGYEKQKYILADKVQEMLEQQREECAVDAVEAFQEADTMAAIPNAIMRACLNAVEKIK